MNPPVCYMNELFSLKEKGPSNIIIIYIITYVHRFVPLARLHLSFASLEITAKSGCLVIHSTCQVDLNSDNE
jgi:hypothetical protein